MVTAVILGGGISGLATAYYLRTVGASKISKVILIEKSKRFGGWIESVKEENNVVHEMGPRSIRAAGKVGKNTLKLVEDLGLSDSVIPVSSFTPAARQRYIVYHGKLTPLPTSITALFRTVAPFKKPLIIHGLKDFLRPRKKLEDESLYDFCVRRFGEDLAMYAIDPICRGIVAGCAKEISVRSLFPNFYRAEQQYGSVIGGNLRINKEAEFEPVEISDLSVRAKKEQWAMWNLRDGLQQLPDTLEAWLKSDPNTEMLNGNTCDSIQFEQNNAKIQIGERSIEANQVISCLPSYSLSQILDSQAAQLAQLLSKIKFVNVASVNLEYPGHVLPVEAFGYLVPSCETSKTLGVVFDSCNFKAHDGNDDVPRTRLTCMMGGHWFEEYFGNVDQADKDYILKVAIEEVQNRLSVKELPYKSHVSIQKNCIPQYVIGHHKIIQQVKDELNNLNIPLSLTGSSYEGVSVNDVIHNAKTTVQNVLDKIP